MKTIVLDPGHGGTGNLTGYGASGNGLVEKELNLLVARYCRDNLLHNYDCRVFMTRDSDTDLHFVARANVVRRNNADILVSIHFNGFNDQRAHGFESFVYSGSLNQNTINYQHAIHNKIYSLLEQHGIRDRGKKRANFAMLRLPPCPCVLPEYAFITNRSDAEVIKKPGMIKLLGDYTAEGIAGALGLARKTTPSVWPVYPIPKVQRSIGVEVDGKRTDEKAYLIDGQTYVRAAYLMGLTGVHVTGHGDYIKIG